MNKSTTPSFVLELEISFSDLLLNEYKPSKEFVHAGTPETLNKKLEVANLIYNAILSETEHRRQKVIHDPDYQQALDAYRKAKKADEDTSPFVIVLNDIKMRYGYTEYDMHAYSTIPKHHFSDALGADECQKLASRAFAASSMVLTGKAKKVRYHRRGEDASIDGKSAKSTFKYKGDRCIQCGRGNLYPLIVKKGDTYAEEALTHDVKYIRVIRRTIRGKRRYFAQLILAGIPPRTKNLRYGRKNSKVGLDEGVSTLAVVSSKEVSLNELAPGTAVDEKKLRRLNRAIDRSRRATNPQNYNPNGTIKRGRLKWKLSKRCLRLIAARKELHRRNAWNRKCAHNQLANRVVSLGQDIRVETMAISGLAKRSKKTAVNKTSGRKRSKKRYGKTVLSRSPAAVISAIDRKLVYIGRKIKKINTVAVKASQYNHKTDTCEKKPLSQRWNDIGNDKIQRDLYSAFLIMNTTDGLDGIDRRACQQKYSKFKTMHDAEIQRLKETDTPALRWYIA